MSSLVRAFAIFVFAFSVTRAVGEPADYEAGQEFTDCIECPTMVVIPAGSFTMGSPSNEEGRYDDEGPQHVVTIPRIFAVGKFEVTRGQYAQFVNETGRSDGDGCNYWTGSEVKSEASYSWRNPGYAQMDSHPVTCVNWDDAKAYVSWLNGKTGGSYRLLSEAEWEYAARAGSTSARSWGPSADEACSYANGSDLTAKDQFSERTAANCRDGHVYTAPVGSFNPNQFGLQDMLGNVWEWLEDCWNDSYAGAPGNGSERLNGICDRRVLRGGSWVGRPRLLRSANRNSGLAGTRGFSFGFRVARTLS